MTGMDAQSLLACWEHGRRRHPLDRALLLFATAEPHADPDSLADRPLGQLNAALLRLRQSLFGDAMKSCVSCPECSENLEFTLSAGSMLQGAPATNSGATLKQFTVKSHTFRLPTSRDLAALASGPEASNASHQLLQRLSVGKVPLELSEELERDISHALDAGDPCLDLALDLACPACEHTWNAPFDIGAFLWEEIDVRARRLLDEVHALARSYSWTESQILALSDTRRRAYLDRVLA